MTNQATVAALIATVSAVGTTLRDTAPGEITNNFPEYADFTLLAGDDALDPGEAAALSFVIAAEEGDDDVYYGDYQCIRSSYHRAFPQVVTEGVVVTHGDTPVQTWYTHDDATLLGKEQVNNDCCLAAEVCKSTTAKEGNAEHRVYTNIGRQTGVAPMTYAPHEWHNDFMLVSSWQDKAKCTSDHVTALAGTKVTVKGATIGAGYKCTYKFTVAADAGAPGFKLAEANFAKFNFHWIEFETAALTNIAPNTSVAPWFSGVLAGSWPFPIKTQSDDSTAGKESNVSLTDMPNSEDPKAYGDGMPGFLMGQPVSGNVWSKTAKEFYSYPSQVENVENYNTRVASYNSAVTAYNTAAAAYNLARTTNANADVFAEPVPVPARPCPPTAPGAYDGPTIVLDNTSALTDAQKADNVITWQEGAPSAANSVKQGYLMAGTTASATSGDKNAGHVYGLLGQLAEWPEAWSETTSEGAFQWKAPTGSHEVIVSVLPYAKADANDKSFSLEAINVQFKTDWEISQTAVSSTPLTGLLAVGAKTLAVSVAAAAAVQAVLV